MIFAILGIPWSEDKRQGIIKFLALVVHPTPGNPHALLVS
jgi:hypothetical protein